MESFDKLKAQKNRILANEAVKIASCVVNKLVHDKAALQAENAELREQGTDLAKFAEGLWNLLSQLNPHNLPGTLDMMWEAQLHHPRQITLLQFAKEWSEADRDRHAARAAELEGTLTEIVAIPNSEAAQGIMKVIARAALAKKEKK